MRIHLQGISNEIQEMQQLHKISENNDIAVYRSVAADIDMNTLNMTEIYK